MRIFLSTTTLLLLSVLRVLAHEGETEVTNVAEADWVGPLVALLIIAGAIIIARAIRTRSDKK